MTMFRDPYWLTEHYQCAQEQGETCKALVLYRAVSVALPGEQFTHTPLGDAAKQIRLLRATSRHDANFLAFELTEHSVDDIPPYIAISYVWGEASEHHKIVINGKWFEVRSSAREALRQTCRDDLEWYIWMDSICINQEDLEEKSSQVEMMADIYRAASLVYACIGPEEDDIEMLLEAHSALDEARSYSFAVRGPEQYCEEPPDEAGNAIATEWPMSRSEDEIVTMCEAFAKLAHRLYWRRMWIVQEICMGDNIQVRCGSHSFDLVFLMQFESAFEELLKLPLPLDWRYCIEASWGHYEEGAMSNAFSTNAETKRPFGRTLNKMKKLECRDDRDRVYALNAMINWGAGQSRLKPDYLKSTFDVLVQAIQHIREDEQEPNASFEHFESLGEMIQYGVLTALKINSSNPQVRSRVTLRHSLHAGTMQETVDEGSKLRKEYSYASARIQSDHNGKLVLAYHQVRDEHSEEATDLLRMLESTQSEIRPSHELFKDRLPQPLFAD